MLSNDEVVCGGSAHARATAEPPLISARLSPRRSAFVEMFVRHGSMVRAVCLACVLYDRFGAGGEAVKESNPAVLAMHSQLIFVCIAAPSKCKFLESATHIHTRPFGKSEYPPRGGAYKSVIYSPDSM